MLLETLLSIENVVLNLGGLNRLDQLSIELKASGITAVIGHNGAGKSLTLRLIAGLETPAEGSVLSAAGLRTALVFQQPIMLRRTVAQNLIHALDVARRPRSLASDLLAMAQLEDQAHQYARSLSGGEQQRLALVRALASKPQLLLLDEPTASLDPSATLQIERLIQDIAKDGTKVLMVTHNLAQAKRLAQDLLFMHNGRVAEHTSSADFFAAPQTLQGQAFIKGELSV